MFPPRSFASCNSLHLPGEPLSLQAALPPQAALLEAVQPHSSGLGAAASSLRTGRARSAAPA